VSAQPGTPVGNLQGADGLRAIACLMVVLHHLADRPELQAKSSIVHELQAFALQGSAGVSAFFVLSGLLLSLPFWRRYLEAKSFPDMLEFTRRRAVRIVPGFYSSLLVSFVLSLVLVPHAPLTWLRLIAGLSFTSALHYVTFFPVELNGPLWSIGFEVICYFLMPLGMYALFKWFPARGLRFALTFWLAVLAFVLLVNQLVLTRLVPDQVGRGWQFGMVGGAKSWMPHYNVIGFFAHCAIGVLVAGWLAQQQRRRRNSSFSFDALALVGLAGAIGVLWFGRNLEEFALSFQTQPYRFPFFAVCIALALVTMPFSRWLGRALDNRFFSYTAKVSFGLYIWHFLVIEVVFLVSHTIGLPYVLLAGVSLLLAFITAELSYRFVESPFLKKRAQNDSR
jgi:peptidoglycan/LPS O-acetylase OafA/YrhL